MEEVKEISNVRPEASLNWMLVMQAVELGSSVSIMHSEEYKSLNLFIKSRIHDPTIDILYKICQNIIYNKYSESKHM
jgi:hypothetical protein